MLGYVVRRVLWTPPLLLLVMLVTFALMRGIGGSPFRLEFGGLPQPLVIEVTRFYGLDEPWYVEFANYVKHVATWSFGPSLTDRYVTVDQVVNEQIPVTLQLTALAILWAIPLGGTLGVVAALRRGSRLDALLTSVSTLLLVVPVFLFSEVLSTYLVRDWQVIEPGWSSWGTKLAASVTLALAPAGYVARVVRAGLVETLGQDFVRTARAKGLRSGRVVGVHVLRNSLVPFLAAAVPTLALLVTAAFFVESSFEIPGAARYFIDAAQRRDYPMVMGLTVVLALVVILANLVADIAAAALDPRLRERRW
ncbi:MAG TPA: ABC transporter permease, partial [Gaiellaceae bacterium]|nr:ABC transporter permease [Gaiellaceae bacterium]